MPLVAWIAVIFGVSSIPQLSSDSFGLPPGFDKVVHFAEYLVLAILLRHGIGGDGQRGAPVLLFVIATGLLVGCLDELYQSLIPGRHPSALDVAADAAGVLAGACLAALIVKRSEGSERS